MESVSYSILFNGSLFGNISLSTGLRQGDPFISLSFYFGFWGFIEDVCESFLEGDIQGIKISRRAPSISHFFFAYDSFMFSRATLSEADMSEE